MTQAKSRIKKRKKYFKFKKKHIGIRLVLFCLLTAAAVYLSLFFSMTFTAYSAQTKLEAGYEKALLYARLYEEESDAAEPYRALDDSQLNYIVKDSEGNIIHSRGDNTASAQSSRFAMKTRDVLSEFMGTSADYENVKVYVDSQSTILVPEKDGTILFDYKRFIRSYTRLLESNEDSDLNNISQKLRSVSLPLWMETEIKDGAEVIVFQVKAEISLSDLIFIYLLIAFMALLIVLMSLVMLINGIIGVVNEGRLQKMFFTDMVTGGHNWLWFLLKGESVLRSRFIAKTGLAVVDLSFINYRRFCACHSLDEGEQLLATIYSTVKATLDKNELCSHNGEGNFALLIKYTDETELKQKLGALIGTLNNSGDGVALSFRAGAALIDPADQSASFWQRRPETDIEKEYNNACTAAASLESSGVCIFDSKLVEEQKWIDTVQQMQQPAVDNEEFIVYYQPKYDPKTKVLRGAEALIRWQSPEYGFITPYKFIPIFEKNGFITTIDHYMLAHAARDQRRWLDMGYTCVPISVNVSRAHFIESDLAEQIRDTIDKEGTPHNLIEIELTESAFFDDKKTMIDTITRLKQYGFSVSMDDFGSGYSSLNSLKDMPLDVLKLDAEFFRGEAAGTARGEIVVAEAIKLARSLNMRTVAEGVEIKEQVDFLAGQGCDMIQGYYFDKPMPGSDFEERMAKGAPPEKYIDIELSDK